MSFIFGHRKKSPTDLVKSTRKHIEIISDTKLDEKIHKKVNTNIEHT
jgi:hypothetical protein